MSTEVPKKFYRNVIRGVSYYTQEKKRACNLDELVAYVYLKNSQALPAHRVEPLVEKALTDLCTTGLVEKVRNDFQLTQRLVGDWPEDLSLDTQELAGPSGSSGPRIKRKTSPRSKRSTKSGKRSRSRSRSRLRAAAVDAIDGVPEPAIEDSHEQESEEDEEYDSEEEVFPHRQLKVEIEVTEERQIPVATTAAAAANTESKQNNYENDNLIENQTEQGSSSTEGSSA